MKRLSLKPDRGQWIKWESIISWKDLWGMTASRISFLLRSNYDILPSTKNLQQWLNEDPSFVRVNPHILTSCKISSPQGRYTWRHNQVLKGLAATIETNSIVRGGQGTKRASSTDQEWSVRASQRLGDVGGPGPAAYSPITYGHNYP